MSEDCYSPRIIDDQLRAALDGLPALLIDGAKGVGKTSTAERVCRTARRLDDPGQRAVISADPSVLGLDAAPVLIDEWQRHPPVWDAVRRLVDENPGRKGRFVLTGSAPTAATHSGAGRIATLRMRPMCLEERQRAEPTVSFTAIVKGNAGPITGSSTLALADYVDEIVTGGYPGMRELSQPFLQQQLLGYTERIVDHDMPDAGLVVRRPRNVRAWLRAYAAATATTATWETIRDAASAELGSTPARASVAAYTDLLVALRILDPLDAWSPSFNTFSRIGGAPKHHLVDPALAVVLLGQSKRTLLAGSDSGVAGLERGALLGNLFESLAAMSIRTYAQAMFAPVAHLRTHQGRHEVDFIVEHDGGIVGIEVKLSAAIDSHDVGQLVDLRTRVSSRWIDGLVLTTGTDAYRRTDGIAVVPLGLLGL